MKYASKIALAATVGFSLAAASTALAAPAAEPRCSRAVTVPEGAPGYMFNDNCQIAYVLPPDEGIAKASATSTNTNLNFCPAVNRVGSVVSKTVEAQELIADKILKMIRDFEPLDEVIAQLGADLAAAKAALDAANAQLALDSERKNELVAAVATANEAYSTCTILNTPEQCQDAKDAVDAAKLELRDFILDTYSPHQQAQLAAKLLFDRLTAELANKTNQYATAVEPLNALQGQLADLSASAMQTYDKYTRMTGITAQLTYLIEWNKLVEAYHNANPNIMWERLPIIRSNFNASVNPVLTGAGGEIPVVLGFSVPGMQGEGAQFFPTGDGTVPPLSTSEPQPDKGPQVMPGGSSVSAQLVFSLLGSCGFYPQGQNGPVVGDVDDLTANMVANMTYEYEVKAHRGYTARYNLSQFVSRLERIKKRGGFFSSKTIREVYESADSNDWFDIQFDQSASGFSYSEQEKKNIASEVKGQLIERALRLIAVQNGSLKGAGALPGLAATGAGTAASYLISGCGYWSWCYVGGVVLGVLDSIFGSKEAVSNFKRNNNVWVTDRVVDATILTRNGSLSFTRE